MSSEQNDTAKDVDRQVQRIYQRLDKFEERIDQLEGQMIVATKWLERIEHRLERMEEVRADLLQAITKLQTELEFKSENTDQEKEIIKQLLSKDKSYQENFAQLLEGEKSRKQERFLQIWAILGPVLASVLTSFFTRFFV
ncbi:hypothetical protein J31TS6_12110 [Brevibacillus reuszeri]|uniref:hypothetical protein n=1 Tax=Brevibacillus reuszeri TaxID=54915 RepID=UPI001B04D093|nr:hypothetical protein [Brevibacillus reuszeri]GIO05183.1 hypothetical protein J31TS6_12110 [Brevibacillus reuszeri]